MLLSQNTICRDMRAIKNLNLHLYIAKYRKDYKWYCVICIFNVNINDFQNKIYFLKSFRKYRTT